MGAGAQTELTQPPGVTMCRRALPGAGEHDRPADRDTREDGGRALMRRGHCHEESFA